MSSSTSQTTTKTTSPSSWLLISHVCVILNPHHTMDNQLRVFIELVEAQGFLQLQLRRHCARVSCRNTHTQTQTTYTHQTQIRQTITETQYHSQWSTTCLLLCNGGGVGDGGRGTDRDLAGRGGHKTSLGQRWGLQAGWWRLFMKRSVCLIQKKSSKQSWKAQTPLLLMTNLKEDSWHAHSRQGQELLEAIPLSPFIYLFIYLFFNS